MLITVPAGFTTGDSCQSTAGSCYVINSTTYMITAPGKQLKNFVVSMSNVNVGNFAPVSPSFSVVYSYDGSNVTVQTSGINVPVYCKSPC
jgi:hypothetical protein